MKTLIEQWYINNPIGGTTYRGFTIQFKIVPEVNFCFFISKLSKNPGKFCFNCQHNFMLGAKNQSLSWFKHDPKPFLSKP